MNPHQSTRKILCLRIAAAISPILSLAARDASADQLYSTGFEAPAFVAGRSVDGQGGFAVSPGNPTVATITTANPNSGNQDLMFTGSQLSASTQSADFYQNTAGVGINYDTATGDHLLTLDAHVMLSGPQTPDTPGQPFSGDLVSVNMEAILKDGSYFSTYLSSDGNAIGFTTGYDFLKPAALGVYHDLTLALDFTARTSTFYLDGQAFGTIAFDPTVTSTTLSSAQFTMYAIDPGADRTAYTANIDDFSARSVPEPGSMMLLALGVAWSVRRRFAHPTRLTSYFGSALSRTS